MGRALIFLKSNKGRLLKWAIILVILGALIFLILKFYLVIKLLLGNDLIVTVETDQENFFLNHTQSAQVNFNIYTTTNAFCTASCIAQFIDLSSETVIRTDSFNLTGASSKSSTYDLHAIRDGEGQELYRFNVSCKSQKTLLCNTAQTLESRSVLITLNYNLSQEETDLKQATKEKLLSSFAHASLLKENLDVMAATVNALNSTADLLPLRMQIGQLRESLNQTDFALQALKHRWETKDYLALLPEAQDLDFGLKTLDVALLSLNASLLANISSFNNLADNISFYSLQVARLKELNVTNVSVAAINLLITDSNDAFASFSFRDLIPSRAQVVNSFLTRLEELKSEVNDESLSIANNETNATSCCFANETISFLAPSKAGFISINASVSSPIFTEPNPECCFFGSCKSCCDDSCSNDAGDYPIIFVHGHDFNKAVSAEHSLDAFNMIQQTLDQEHVSLNAGSLILGSSEPSDKGIWGRVNQSVSLRVSYYFDIYTTSGNERVIQTKVDNLDSYALRLRDIINLVQYKTGRKKVTLVAHSMGGLVSRRYLQIFGSENVDKLIMVGTPNHGIDADTQGYCPILGSATECQDMNKDSLFINKLENAGSPGIPVYNIIGVGCAMKGGTGDGIVERSSAYLDFAQNYEVNGTCNIAALNFLHTNLLNVQKYPKVYALLNRSLQETVA